MVQATINGHEVAAIINTGSLGIVMSESCMKRLGLKADKQLSFKINTATESTLSKQDIFYKLPIIVRKRTVEFPVLVL